MATRKDALLTKPLLLMALVYVCLSALFGWNPTMIGLAVGFLVVLVLDRFWR